MVRWFLLTACLMVTAMIFGCASAGKQFDTTHVNDVKIGQDKSQIQTWFGSPNTSTAITGHPKGCTERWMYTYAHAVGFGKVTESKTLVVDYDSKGKVCDHAYSGM